MLTRKQLYILIAVVVLVAIGAYVYKYHSKNDSKSEGYAYAGEWDYSLDDQYEMLDAPEAAVPTPHFADLVDAGDQKAIQDADTLGSIRPLERLHRHSSSRMMPRTSKAVTPYNIDVADPKSHFFQVNMPRVQLKDPQWQSADPYRGDIPIKFHPNVCLVNKSRYGTRSSWRGDGYFSPYYKELYAKYTGQGYLNKPIHVANEETVMDFVPAEYTN